MWVQFALLLKVIFELERRIPNAPMNETKAQKPDRGIPEKKSHMWPSPIHAAAAKNRHHWTTSATCYPMHLCDIRFTMDEWMSWSSYSMYPTKRYSCRVLAANSMHLKSQEPQRPIKSVDRKLNNPSFQTNGYWLRSFISRPDLKALNMDPSHQYSKDSSAGIFKSMQQAGPTQKHPSLSPQNWFADISRCGAVKAAEYNQQ